MQVRLRGCGSDLVAQLVEQRPFKAWVLGSNPSGIKLACEVRGFGPASPFYFLSSVGLEHLVYTEKVVGSNPTGSTMKKLLFVIPILFSSCATQSDLINLGVAASMFTAVATMEDWAPEKVSEQIKEKKIKNREEYEARIAAKLAKKEANEKESD